MRIWAFPSAYPYDMPGMSWSGIFAHRQYKALQVAGAEVNVVQPTMWHPGGPFSNLFPDWKEAKRLHYPKERMYDGIQVYHPRIANMKPGRVFRKPYTERYADAIVRLFREKGITPDPSVDIFYSQWLPEAYQAQAAAKRLGLKTAILIIGDDILIYPHASKGNFNTIRSTIEQANGRFAVAKYLGDEANKLLGTTYQFDAIRRGVNYNFFTPVSAAEQNRYRQEFGIPQDKIIILTVGSPIVRKGWLDLFDALQVVKQNHSDFVLAGAYSGPGEIDLGEEVKKRGLEDNFINLGEVVPEKINKLYNAADIFCLPSHWEGIANCVVEAMASGLPVITTNVCGHPEVIRSSDTGILIPPKQPGLLAEKLSFLLGDKNARMQLGENARTFIVNEWGNFNDNAARLYGRLQDIINNK